MKTPGKSSSLRVSCFLLISRYRANYRSAVERAVYRNMLRRNRYNVPRKSIIIGRLWHYHRIVVEYYVHIVTKTYIDRAYGKISFRKRSIYEITTLFNLKLRQFLIGYMQNICVLYLSINVFVKKCICPFIHRKCSIQREGDFYALNYHIILKRKITFFSGVSAFIRPIPYKGRQNRIYCVISSVKMY